MMLNSLWQIGILIIVLFLGPQWSFAQDESTTDCSGNLERARGQFENSLRISEVPDLLIRCLELERFTDNQERADATSLVTLSYINLENREEANTWIRRLIRANPKYKADPEEVPASYRSTFRKEKRRRMMFRVVPATVVAGTTIYFVTRPADPELLPFPPSSPSSIQ